MWSDIRAHFTQNLLANEVRGANATGVALVAQSGRVELYKRPLPAGEFVSDPAYLKLLSHLCDESTCLLGHTRKPTKGSPDNPHNNQPLVTGRHLGVHNGTICNDDALFAQQRLPRLGDVDSEIIFRLWHEISPQKTQYFAKLARAANSLQGTFATLSIDLRDPSALIASRYHQPLCLHYHAPWQAVVFSSRYIYLRKTFGKSVNAEMLPDEHLFYFHADRIADKRHAPLSTAPIVPGVFADFI